MKHPIRGKAAFAFGLLAAALAASAQGTAGSTPSPTAPAAAATGTTAKGSALSSADKAFVQKAAIGGMAEVEMGNLAQQKAANEQVKQFGARMAADHSKANDELKQVASGKGIDVPTALDKKHQADLDRFGKMTGAQFDKAYMSHMVDDHKKDVADFKKEAGSGKDADIKGFASKTLPTLQEHLKLAQSTHDAVKTSK